VHISAMALPVADITLTTVLDSVTQADAGGFHRAWLPQLPPVPGLAPWDALTALALAGQHARRIELGTSVNVAYHQHPLTLARQAMTTNTAVDGRLTLGIGTGHQAMVEALGHPFARPAQYMREFLEILVPAMAGEPVDYHGSQLTAVGQVELAGASAPRVVIAALGPRMLDLAAELTNGTVTTWTGPRTLEEHVVPRITARAADLGRPAPEVIATLPVVVTHDVDGVRQSLSEDFSYTAEMPSYRGVLDREGVDGVGGIAVAGDEEQVAAQLRRLAEIGVTEFVGLLYGDPDTARRTTALLAELQSEPAPLQ
jgi:F420-dependent oxidoreductase-like protein